MSYKPTITVEPPLGQTVRDVEKLAAFIADSTGHTVNLGVNGFYMGIVKPYDERRDRNPGSERPTPEPSLGEIHQALQGFINRGVTIESLQWVLDHKISGRPTEEEFVSEKSKNPVELNAALAGHEVVESGDGNSLFVDGYVYSADEFVLAQILETNEAQLNRASVQVGRVRAAMRYLQSKKVEPTAEEVAAVQSFLSTPIKPSEMQDAAYRIAREVRRAQELSKETPETRDTPGNQGGLEPPF